MSLLTLDSDFSSHSADDCSGRHIKRNKLKNRKKVNEWDEGKLYANCREITEYYIKLLASFSL